MVIRWSGTFKGGVVVPDDGKALPDGTRVKGEAEVSAESVPTLGAFLKACAGTMKGPPDLARNHDHYAHGAPKGVDDR